MTTSRMQTHHLLTILAVADLARAAAFYEAAFGFKVRVSTPNYIELELDGERGLGLYARDGFSRNTGIPTTLAAVGTTTTAELYFRCDDLDAAIARMIAASAHVLSARAARAWGDEAAYFTDVDGNVLVLSSPA